MSEQTMREMPKARAEKWEADESIITLNGAIVGCTLRDADAARVARWLNEGGLKGIAASLAGEVSA